MNKINYTQVGDYLLPNLKISGEKADYGKYGMLRKQYLKEHCEGQYNLLKMKCELNQHLNEVDKSAKAMFERIVAELEKKETPPPQGTMEWVRWQNGLRAIADEQVLSGLIYN